MKNLKIVNTVSPFDSNNASMAKLARRSTYPNPKLIKKCLGYES